MATIYPNFKNGKIVSFKFKAYLGRAENGRQIFRCKTWFPEKQMSENKLRNLAEKEATIWEHQLIEDARNIQPISVPDNMTFENFVKNVWFPEYMNTDKRRAATVAFHDYILRTILPYLGQEKLSHITPNRIEEYLDYLKNTYKTKDNKSLSPKTIRHHYGTLNLIFSYAEKTGHITSNPITKVDVPKIPKQKVNALSKSQVITFIEEVEKLPLMQQAIYHLLLTTGIRRGECYGLKWQDVDLENMLIHIERNVTYTKTDGLQIGPPKTDLGIRDIPLTKHTTSLLSVYKAHLSHSYTIEHSMFVFPSAESPYEPHQPAYITKHMKKFMKRIGLPDMSPHDLRHTCASLLLQSGADIKSVQDILGHADASTTLNYYAKSDINVMRSSTQKAFDL